MEERMVSVRDGMFEVQTYEYGDPKAEPLLWLHPSNSLMRAPYLDRLAESYHVIAPLHPGWGDSTGLEHIDDPVDMAMFYYDYLETLGITAPINVVGHSIGGMFAAEFAAVDPHRAKRVVCCNAVGLWRDDLPTLDFFSEDMGTVQPAVWFDPTGPAALSILPDMSSAEKIAESMFKYAVSLSAAAKFLWPIPERGLQKRLHRISTPTLLLWGEHDKLVSAAYAEEFKSRIKDARVAIFDKSGHFPMIEEPEKFVETVVGFLRG